jgi:MSHA biogenesis protein MshP
MRPEPRLPRRAQGFALVAAIFVMVIIALVVTAMARLSITQHGTVSLSIQQARAYQAARAGLEWGISRALNNDVDNAGDCPSGNTPAGRPNLLGSNLGEFTLEVTWCSASYTDNAGSPVQILRFYATAQNGSLGSRPDYAYRQLTATIEK